LIAKQLVCCSSEDVADYGEREEKESFWQPNESSKKAYYHRLNLENTIRQKISDDKRSAIAKQ
jgi:hypothetical protein